MNCFLLILAIVVQAYLLGSVSCGILISKVFYHEDVRTKGSGNAGMTNILRTYGKTAAGFTLAGDALKGAIAVWIGQALFALVPQTVFAPFVGGYIALVFAVLGHFKPVFFDFRGGKGVSVVAGCLIALNPVVIAILITVFLLVVIPSRMVSLASICAAITYPIATIVYGIFGQGLTGANLALSAAISLLIGGAVIYMHRANITRIKNGTEYKFDGKNKKA